MKIVYFLMAAVLINIILVLNVLGFNLIGDFRSFAGKIGDAIGLKDPLYFMLFAGTMVTVIVGFIFLMTSPKK